MLNHLHPQHLLSVHRHPCPKSVIHTSPRAKLIVSDLCCFIHRGMVDCTSQIWSDRNLHRVILRGMVDHTSLTWNIRT